MWTDGEFPRQFVAFNIRETGQTYRFDLLTSVKSSSGHYTV